MVYNGSYTESPELVKELVKQVATHIGPFARPGMIVGTPGLPKTRSGQFLFLKCWCNLARSGGFGFVAGVYVPVFVAFWSLADSPLTAVKVTTLIVSSYHLRSWII